MTAYQIGVLVLNCVARWKLFEKAGEQGWKAIIPYYNDYIYCKLANCVKLFVADLILGVLFAVTVITACVEWFVTTAQGIASAENAEEYLISLVSRGVGITALALLGMLVLLIALIVIRIFINLKFVKRFSDETVFKVLAGIGCVPIFNIALVVARCILAFDEKYRYRRRGAGEYFEGWM